MNTHHPQPLDFSFLFTEANNFGFFSFLTPQVPLDALEGAPYPVSVLKPSPISLYCTCAGVVVGGRVVLNEILNTF